MHCLAPRLIAFFLLSAAVGLHERASAQDIYPTPNRSDRPTVAEQVRRGRIARDAGRWADAHAAYKAALDATDSAESTAALRAEIAGELGLCELALKRYRDAAEHLASSIPGRNVLSPALQRRFDNGLRKALPHVVTLYLSVTPPDAEVLIDGKSVGRPAGLYRLFLESGRHILRVSSAGHEPAFQSFDGAAGKDVTITMTLPRAAASAKATAGGEQKNASSRAQAPVTSPAKQSSTTLSSVTSALVVPGAVLTGVTAVTGGTFMILAEVKESQLHDRAEEIRRSTGARNGCSRPDASQSCQELPGMQAERDLYRTLGYVGLAASGVAAAVTVASLLVGRAPSDEDKVRVVPIASGQLVGISVAGAL